MEPGLHTKLGLHAMGADDVELQKYPDGHVMHVDESTAPTVSE